MANMSMSDRMHISQEIVTPDVLYEEVVEVDERVVLQQDRCQVNKQCERTTGKTGEMVCGINYIKLHVHIVS